ncbi:MAG: SDR family NAD(P)-dependent oxidoreductase [Acidobacteriota bacterium]
MSQSINEWSGREVLITGATSGIGLAFAQRLAAVGAELILTARSLDRLTATADQLRAEFDPPRPIHLFAADLATPSGPAQLVGALREAGRRVDLLINNAGFGLAGEFATQQPDRQLEMIQLNVVSLVALTRLLLPAMIERRAGAIIQVASMAAFQGVPWLALYAGTKAMVMNFTEGLAHECRPHGVRVMALCPGPTTSAFHTTAGAAPRGSGREMMSAEEVVDYALTQLARGRTLAIPGTANRLTLLFERFAPRSLVTRAAARLYQPE